MAKKKDYVNVTVTDWSDGTQDIEIKEEQMQLDVRCCGACCWMFGENCDGDGCCAKHYLDFTPNCSDGVCDDYTSMNDLRHHLAVLTQIKRILRHQEVGEYTKVNVPSRKDQKQAIDFVVEYVKTYSKL